MNINTLSSTTLAKDTASKLADVLRGVPWLKEPLVTQTDKKSKVGVDFSVSLRLPDKSKVTLCVLCRRELRPSVFPVLSSQFSRDVNQPKGCVPVLALPWVSPRMVELCAEHGWSWFDLAGNYRLDVPGLLRIAHTGNPPVHVCPRPSANLGTSEAGRVIRVLLSLEHAGKIWTQREMQEQCLPGVSLGLVNKVARHLRDEAFLETGESGGFRLSQPQKLLFAWRDAYRFDRHVKRGYFSLLNGERLRKALRALDAEITDGGSTAYAAFSAADFQAPHVRQPKTWLYVREQDLPSLEKSAEAKEVDSGENLVVLIPNDEGVFYQLDRSADGVGGEERVPCTSLVQTYVDLWHCGGRGKEAAEALLTQRLTPEWKSQGLSA